MGITVNSKQSKKENSGKMETVAVAAYAGTAEKFTLHGIGDSRSHKNLENEKTVESSKAVNAFEEKRISKGWIYIIGKDIKACANTERRKGVAVCLDQCWRMKRSKPVKFFTSVTI